MVFGFQLKRVHNESDAEDITIEAFAKAFDKIEHFDTNYNFSSWVITISKNIQIDQHRKQRNSSPRSRRWRWGMNGVPGVTTRP